MTLTEIYLKRNTLENFSLQGTTLNKTFYVIRLVPFGIFSGPKKDLIISKSLVKTI